MFLFVLNILLMNSVIDLRRNREVKGEKGQLLHGLGEWWTAKHFSLSSFFLHVVCDESRHEQNREKPDFLKCFVSTTSIVETDDEEIEVLFASSTPSEKTGRDASPARGSSSDDDSSRCHSPSSVLSVSILSAENAREFRERSKWEQQKRFESRSSNSRRKHTPKSWMYQWRDPRDPTQEKSASRHRKRRHRSWSYLNIDPPEIAWFLMVPAWAPLPCLKGNPAKRSCRCREPRSES